MNYSLRDLEYKSDGKWTLTFKRVRVDAYSRFQTEFCNFPDEYYKQLSHLILSHHGKLEHGSPVVPMTLEALILHYADELDSKIDAYLRISESEKTGEKKWSNYVRLLDRFFYFPPHPEIHKLENDEQ